MIPRRKRTSVLFGVVGWGLVIAAGWLAPAIEAGHNSELFGDCDQICTNRKPCDKYCLIDGEVSTCGDFGVCADPNPDPTPTPAPTPIPDPGGCKPPVISANPENGIDSDNDGFGAVNLRVTNASNDINNWSFAWHFGDGAEDRDNLVVNHSFRINPVTGYSTYTVFWEGWARCQNGQDRYVTATKMIQVNAIDSGRGTEPENKS